MAVHGGNGADIEPARRLCGQEKGQLRERYLPRQYRLLLIAPGKGRKRDIRPGRAHIKTRHQVARGLHEFVAPQEPERREGVEPVEKHVFSDAHLDYTADCMPILGHDTNPDGGDLLWAELCGLHFAEEDTSAGWLQHSRQHGGKFALAVAFDPGDANDFTGPDR